MAESSKLGTLLRVGIFAFMEMAGLTILGPMLLPMVGYVAAAALSTFGAAAIANSVAIAAYERGGLADVGLGWGAASKRNLALGLAGGIGAAVVVLAPPLILGLAHWEPAGEGWGGLGSILFVSLLLLFGAIGEELLFRGYGFQVLLGTVGRFATILPMAALFGVAHANNQNASTAGIVNTVLWGLLFCFAFLKSRDLWLPIGIHYGWNVTLPLFGANLSGFTMKVTGYSMRWSIGDVWSGGEYGPEAGVLTTGVVLLLFVLLWKAPVAQQVSTLYRQEVESARMD